MLNFYIVGEFLYTAPHRTAHVTAKIRCGAVMVLAKLYTAPHCTAHVTTKIRYCAVMILAKSHRKMQC